MTSVERRQKILALLSESREYQNATQIARRFGVSRQIIVSDIALLRAEGNEILSTPRGYLLDAPGRGEYVRPLVCLHSKEQIRQEFYAVVDLGGRVLDVVVEHPVYGQISAALNIRSRYDADLFIEKMAQAGTHPLSSLTGGLHVHHIAAPTEEDFSRIQKALQSLHILWE